MRRQLTAVPSLLAMLWLFQSVGGLVLRPRRLPHLYRTAASTARPSLHILCSAAPRRPVMPQASLLAVAGSPPQSLVTPPVHSPAAELDEEHSHVEDRTEVHLVTTVEEAHVTLEALRQLPADMFHACDTEVAGLDIDKSPLGQPATVICISVYSGPEADYGSGMSACIAHPPRSHSRL